MSTVSCLLHSRVWQRCGLPLLAALLFTAGPSWITAASAAELAAGRKDVADRLVKEALHREIYGMDAQRDELLQRALQESPDHAAARWQSGQVRHRGRWVKFDAVPKLSAQNAALVKYRRIRLEYAETAEDQMKLARWCANQKLDAQQRAHLTRVLQFDPDHAEARRRLGFRRVDGMWISREEMKEAEERAIALREALERWTPTLRKVRTSLDGTSRLGHEQARLRLLKIEDPAAIPAIESVLARHSEEAGRLVVLALSRMTAHQAAVALAREAVLSPWPAVRQQAVEQLKTRPREDYVPALLSAMHTRAVTRTELFAGRGGRLVYRHVVRREGQDRNEVAVFDTEYRRLSRAGGSRGETLLRAIGDAQQTAARRELVVVRENLETLALNDRITWVLEESTGAVVASQPESWWQWWNDQNEVVMLEDKPTQQIYRQQQVRIADSGGPPPMSGDCLAAGTMVWTSTGPARIEEIEVGDTVLAQDPETGALAFKPVLRTTIRPASRLITIVAADQSISTSGGHLFWIAGEGWKKSRNVNSGCELHGVDGPVRVSEVKEAGFEPTYNLVVEDFHSYFVGDGKVLCHDNTVRRPTNAVVPGLTDY